MIRAVVGSVGLLVAIVGVVIAIGYALPRDHTASRHATFPAPADRVFAVLQDVDRYPEWRSDIAAVEVLSRTPAITWRERGSNGTITFEMREQLAPSRIVTRIADASLAFGGSWTYVLTPTKTGTSLTITENGEVYNPIFRFMARFVFGHTATLDRFLSDLTRRLGA